VIATACALLGVGLVLSVRGRPRGGARDDRALALLLDLAAGALRAGLPPAAALEAAAPVASDVVRGEIEHVVRLLRLGADMAEAWQASNAMGLAPAGQLASLSAVSGNRLAAAWEQQAAELRDQQRAGDEARAARAGVLALLPLGLCFLPAFVCLGIAPTLIGLVDPALRAAS
jgi:Flp pilus assembly protein TadB